MTAPDRRVRLAEVAERAGVSQMTVSRVLNGSAQVSASTRERVERAVAELDYRVNAAARSLVTGRSGTIGVLAVEAPHYGPASALQGIDAAAADVGLSVTVVMLRSADPDAVRLGVERLGRAGVDGVIALAPVGAAVEGLRALVPGRPLVVVSGDEGSAGATVRVEQGDAVGALVGHLLGLGHRTVHHLRGPAGWWEADARAAAWRGALEAARAPVTEPLVGDWSARSGYELGRRLTGDHSVTAVFAANDQMALGLLRALDEDGRSVPAEVSVVGFDDTPEAAYFIPPLTTVRQDFQEVGRRSVALLQELMSGGDGPAHLVVQPDLVVRQSAGPPPGRW